MSVLLVRQNWADKLSMKYSFVTKVHGSPTLVEQRMKIVPTPIRTLKLSGWEYDLVKWRNLLRGLINSSFDVPLLMERFSASGTGSVLGLTSVTAIEDIEHFYNLQALATKVLLMNWDLLDYEELTIDSIVGDVITFTAAITKDWGVGACDFYPTMEATMETLEIEEVTDYLMGFDMTLKEI